MCGHEKVTFRLRKRPSAANSSQRMSTAPAEVDEGGGTRIQIRLFCVSIGSHCGNKYLLPPQKGHLSLDEQLVDHVRLQPQIHYFLLPFFASACTNEQRRYQAPPVTPSFGHAVVLLLHALSVNSKLLNAFCCERNCSNLHESLRPVHSKCVDGTDATVPRNIYIYILHPINATLD